MTQTLRTKLTKNNRIIFLTLQPRTVTTAPKL